MPCLERSSYNAPGWLPGGHAQTMYPALFRRMRALPFRRVRLSLPDGDCISVDMALADRAGKSRSIVILSHGLEGDSRRKYILGMGRAFLERGADVAARNFRCCGGEVNLLPGMYHSGQTEDLDSVVRYCLEQGYARIYLLGFSMGGNQVLKYLGEKAGSLPSEIVGAAAFSVPCHLADCAQTLDAPSNRLYMEYFLRSLRVKIRQKHVRFPGLYPLDGLDDIRTFKEFDGRYTAPVHGFSSAEDYWEKASCLPFLQNIAVRTLLVNAANDPFLAPSCYPTAAARASKHLFFEMPDQGGHVGFTPREGELYWSEKRALEFFPDLLQGRVS